MSITNDSANAPGAPNSANDANDAINKHNRDSNEKPDVEKKIYVHSNHHASDQMATLLSETLSQYPGHYQASLGILKGVTSGQRGWRCSGAMETGLTQEGMEVTFDYRRVDPSWRRFLIIITMNNGAVTYRDFKELHQGQHSGIRAFEGQV